MNKHSDIDRVLRHWMDDGPSTMPDRVVDIVADRINVQHQQRSWPLPWRLAMNPLFKLGAAAAAVLVIAVVGWNLLPGQPSVGGLPTPSPTATSASTSTPVATGPIALPEGTLTGGRYLMQPALDRPSLTIVADIPAGWVGWPYNGAITSPGGSDEGVAIVFMHADGLFSDPCHWDLDGTGAWDQPGDVAVGPTVDDLVEALRANTSYTTSTPSPVTFGAFQGSELELQLPGADVLSTCDREPGGPKGLFYVFSGDGAGWYSQGPDNRWRLFIVDVDGTRLITMINYFAATPQVDVAAAQAIVESLEFTP